MANYPGALPNPAVAAGLTSHAQSHTDLRAEVIAIATELGLDPSGTSATVRARLDAGGGGGGGTTTPATETAAGIAPIATQTEVNTGTNDTDFVTPLKAATRYLPKTVTAKGDLIVGTGAGTVTRVPAGANGNFVRYDSTATGGITSDPGGIVLDDEVTAHIPITTTTGAVATRIDSTMSTPMNGGEVWWIQGELTFDADYTGGVIIGVSAIGSIASGARCRGTVVGPPITTTSASTIDNTPSRRVSAIYGTIPPGGSTASQAISWGFGGLGYGQQFPVTVNLKVKVGTSLVGGTAVGLTFGQRAPAAAVGTMNLWEGSSLTFARVS